MSYAAPQVIFATSYASSYMINVAPKMSYVDPYTSYASSCD